jgi:DNA-binding HxlR family transcriptional regulator
MKKLLLTLPLFMLSASYGNPDPIMNRVQKEIKNYQVSLQDAGPDLLRTILASKAISTIEKQLSTLSKENPDHNRLLTLWEDLKKSKELNENSNPRVIQEAINNLLKAFNTQPNKNDFDDLDPSNSLNRRPEEKAVNPSLKNNVSLTEKIRTVKSLLEDLKEFEELKENSTQEAINNLLKAFNTQPKNNAPKKNDFDDLDPSNSLNRRPEEKAVNPLLKDNVSLTEKIRTVKSLLEDLKEKTQKNEEESNLDLDNFQKYINIALELNEGALKSIRKLVESDTQSMNILSSTETVEERIKSVLARLNKQSEENPHDHPTPNPSLETKLSDEEFSMLRDNTNDREARKKERIVLSEFTRKALSIHRQVSENMELNKKNAFRNLEKLLGDSKLLKDIWNTYSSLDGLDRIAAFIGHESDTAFTLYSLLSILNKTCNKLSKSGVSTTGGSSITDTVYKVRHYIKKLSDEKIKQHIWKRFDDGADLPKDHEKNYDALRHIQNFKNYLLWYKDTLPPLKESPLITNLLPKTKISDIKKGLKNSYENIKMGAIQEIDTLINSSFDADLKKQVYDRWENLQNLDDSEAPRYISSPPPQIKRPILDRIQKIADFGSYLE